MERLPGQLALHAIFDRAMAVVREVVEMPHSRASLLVRLILQNGGRLSATKRGQFAELTDGEVAAIEAAVVWARDVEERREAADDLLELCQELGLYD